MYFYFNRAVDLEADLSKFRSYFSYCLHCIYCCIHIVFFVHYCSFLSMEHNKPVRYLSEEGLEASSFDGVTSPGFEAVIRVFILHLELLYVIIFTL